MPHNTKHVLGDVHQSNAIARRASAVDGRERCSSGVGEPPMGGPCCRSSCGRPSSSPVHGDDTINASTMLGQSKTVHQAEIDAACELIDFWRFNVAFRGAHLLRATDVRHRDVEPAGLPAARGVRLRGHSVQLHVDRRQPPDRSGADGQHRRVEAVAHSGVQSAHYLMKLFQAAGLPDGVINMVHGPGPEIGEAVVAHPELAGIHFTGSTRNVRTGSGARSARRSISLPVLPAHRRRDGWQGLHRGPPVGDRWTRLATAIIRGAFEYQGQKCSAASRVYVPSNLWERVARADRRRGPEHPDG